MPQKTHKPEEIVEKLRQAILMMIRSVARLLTPSGLSTRARLTSLVAANQSISRICRVIPWSAWMNRWATTG